MYYGSMNADQSIVQIGLKLMVMKKGGRVLEEGHFHSGEGFLSPKGFIIRKDTFG